MPHQPNLALLVAAGVLMSSFRNLQDAGFTYLYSLDDTALMHLGLRILRWVLNVVFLCMLLSLGTILTVPRLLGVEYRAVASGSMEPTISVGAIVIVIPVDPSTIHVGDAITFMSPETPGMVVTHRVIEVIQLRDSLGFRTQGDANKDVDLVAVSAQNVLGRAPYYVPYVGHLTQFVRTRKGWIYLVVVPAGVLILSELVGMLKTIWSSDEGVSEGPESNEEQADRDHLIESSEMA